MMRKAILPLLLSGMVGASVSAVSQDTAPESFARPELFAACGGFLEGVVVDPSGAVWVLELFGDQILSVSQEGECVKVGSTGGVPNGAKWTAEGTLLIADMNGLFGFDPESGETRIVADRFAGEPLTGLNDLSIDRHGGVYFTAPWGSSVLEPTGRVFYLPPGASEPELLADGLAFPNGIAVHPRDPVVLVAEFAGKRILSLPAAGEADASALPHVYAYTQGGVGTDGMIFDDAGRLFAANLGTGEVLAFGADGVPIGSIRLPNSAGRSVTNLAIGNGYLYITEAERGEIYRVSLHDRSPIP